MARKTFKVSEFKDYVNSKLVLDHLSSVAFSGKQCPATVDNSQAQCLTCSLCDGTKTNIFVEVHGTGASNFVAAV